MTSDVVHSVAKVVWKRLHDLPLEDRKRPLEVKLDARTVPSLHKAPPAEARHLWTLLEVAYVESGLAQLKYAKGDTDEHMLYRRPALVFQPGVDDAIRKLAGLPDEAPFAARVAKEWVLRHPDDEHGAQVLARMLPSSLGCLSEEQVVKGLETLRQAQADEQLLLLRQVSARCFQGLSKVLDDKASFLCAWLQVEEVPFLEMPIHLQLHVPASASSVLFIENLTTFEQLLRHAPNRLALVYAQGFKATAARIGDSCRLFCTEQSTKEGVAWFTQCVLGRNGDTPMYFWGDLDFAGMAILGKLRNVFGNVTAWQPGYDYLLAELKAGRSHAAAMADKTNQRVPGPTGCSYADVTLLAALYEFGGFVDQEAVSSEELSELLVTSQ